MGTSAQKIKERRARDWEERRARDWEERRARQRKLEAQRERLILRRIAVVLVAVLIVTLLLIWPAWAYQWPWTGLGGAYSPPQNPKSPRTYYPPKRLWDVLQLLIVPAVLAGAALWFNATEKRRDQEIAQKNRDADQAIAEKRQQDSALDTYLATMTTLLLDEKLRESLEGSEVRAVARAQTLTVLRRLDEKGKGDVVRFVYESGLIYRDKAVLDLNRADLSGADLDEADLSGADLSGADLRRADLSDADLTGTKLTGAYLEDADLGGAKGTTREQLREVVAETLSGTQVLVHP